MKYKSILHRELGDVIILLHHLLTAAHILPSTVNAISTTNMVNTSKHKKRLHFDNRLRIGNRLHIGNRHFFSHIYMTMITISSIDGEGVGNQGSKSLPPALRKKFGIAMQQISVHNNTMNHLRRSCHCRLCHIMTAIRIISSSHYIISRIRAVIKKIM